MLGLELRLLEEFHLRREHLFDRAALEQDRQVVLTHEFDATFDHVGHYISSDQSDLSRSVLEPARNMVGHTALGDNELSPRVEIRLRTHERLLNFGLYRP